MRIAWNDILKLPETALADGRRVPKAQIVRQGGLTKAQAKMLDSLNDITFFASLGKSNSYIQPVKTDEYDIESIVFLCIRLRTSAASSETLHVLHDCFPNPTVFLVEGSGDSKQIGLSVAIRRKSLSERGAFVTEGVAGTGLFDPSKNGHSAFIDQISYSELPQTTLLDYASALADRCLVASTVETLGFYPRCKDDDAEELMREVGRMRSIEARIGEMQRARKSKDATLAETTKLRVGIRKLETERDGVMRDIKELCL